MKNKSMIWIFAVILLVATISTVSADESLIYKQFKGGVLEVPVFENDMSKCTTCTCTISINFPNGTSAVRGVTTGISSNYAVYNLSSNQTSTLGVYQGDIHCTNGADNGAATFEYEVTPTGFVGTLGFYFLVLLISLGIMVLGFYVKDAPLVILGSFGLYFIGIYILFFGIDGMRDPVYTWAIGIIVLMVAAYISVKSSLELLEI